MNNKKDEYLLAFVVGIISIIVICVIAIFPVIGEIFFIALGIAGLILYYLVFIKPYL